MTQTATATAVTPVCPKGPKKAQAVARRADLENTEPQQLYLDPARFRRFKAAKP